MILTTTPSVEGRTIAEYKGIVFGEVITGINFIKDFGAGLRNIFGGRSGSYERELLEARMRKNCWMHAIQHSENLRRELVKRERMLSLGLISTMRYLALTAECSWLQRPEQL